MAVVALSGCALRGPAPGDLAQAPAELAATPFFEQRVDHCGPAALATLLVDSGRTELTPDALSPVLFREHDKGDYLFVVMPMRI